MGPRGFNVPLSSAISAESFEVSQMRKRLILEFAPSYTERWTGFQVQTPRQPDFLGFDAIMYNFVFVAVLLSWVVGLEREGNTQKRGEGMWKLKI